jgi:hypothetical protein
MVTVVVAVPMLPPVPLIQRRSDVDHQPFFTARLVVTIAVLAMPVVDTIVTIVAVHPWVTAAHYRPSSPFLAPSVLTLTPWPTRNILGDRNAIKIASVAFDHLKIQISVLLCSF